MTEELEIHEIYKANSLTMGPKTKIFKSELNRSIHRVKDSVLEETNEEDDSWIIKQQKTWRNAHPKKANIHCSATISWKGEYLFIFVEKTIT